MALQKRSYKKSEIENFDVNNIPKEFVDYITKLDSSIQEALLESRKDIADKLGLVFDNTELTDVIDDVNQDENGVDVELPQEDASVSDSDEIESSVVTDENSVEANVGPTIDTSALPENSDDDIEEEQEEQNEESEGYTNETVDKIELDTTGFIYDAEQLEKGRKEPINPVNVFTLKKDQMECVAHRCKLTQYELRFGTYGMFVYYCPKCKFIYKGIDNIEGYKRQLNSRSFELNYISLEETNRYLLSHMDPIELGEDATLYYADTWIQEHPTCFIHDEALNMYPYRVTYKDRHADFYAHHCGKCDKVIVRKSRVNKMLDFFSEMKVKAPNFELHQAPLPKKTVVAPKKINAEYYVDNGKKVKYEGKQQDCYQLEETDTVVVSDTRFCEQFGHETEDVLVSIKVKPKRASLTAFLCVAGYCAECEKYHMEATDYNVLYKAGRPEITVIDNTEDEDYQITSGETFNRERQHLREFESDVSSYETSILNQPDYISQYATGGDLGDGLLDLKTAKSFSKEKYGPILDALGMVAPKPYKHHVNLSYQGKKLPFYVGLANVYAKKVDNHVELRISETADSPREGEVQVVYSSNDRNFGGKIVNYRTVDIEYKGEKCDITLIRELDIEAKQLYGYNNIRTNSDLVFRSGITDPFLIKVLKNRRRGHQPDDIYTTIQENQNAIVDEPMQQNIIVQGCAGSGKTMVLLHRLSAMKYNHPEYNFGNAIILTPNEHFNLHIKGVADSMQIGGILRESIEQYYIDVLMRYDERFKPQNKIGNEMKNGVSQNFVDFVYSDDFIKWFDYSYEKVLQQRNDFCQEIQEFAGVFDIEPKSIDLNVNKSVFAQYKAELERYYGYIRAREREYEDEVKKLETKMHRKEFLVEKKEVLRKEVLDLAKNISGSVDKKISERIQEIKEEHANDKGVQAVLYNELEQIQKSLNPFGKSAKIEEKVKEIQVVDKRIEINEQLLKDIDSMVKRRKAAPMKFNDFLVWAKEMSLYVPAVMNDIRSFNTMYDEYNKFHQEHKEVTVELDELQKNVARLEESCYSSEIKSQLASYEEQLKKYDLLPLFERVFSGAVEEFVKLNKIKLGKTVRRYTLYAQILFAEKFFDREDNGYSMFYIDEGQDLAINEYKLIRRLNGIRTIFNIFGDTNQLMKPNRGIDDWSVLAEEMGAKEFSLNENYRNTNQITKFCNRSFDMNVLQTGVDGSKVIEIDRSELEQQLNELSLDGERVAILVPRKVTKRTLKDEDALKKKNVQEYKQGYLDYEKLSSKISEMIDDTLTEGKIAYMYVDEVKGVEFDKVFVVANGMTENEKYIAYTRALSDLILVVDETIQGAKPRKKAKIPEFKFVV